MGRSRARGFEPVWSDDRLVAAYCSVDPTDGRRHCNARRNADRTQLA